MNIGEAATKSGIPAKMIRYYESIGLLAAAKRTRSGYRVYTDADVEELRFVQRARSLGFAVSDIGALLTLWHDRKRASSDVKRIALDHIAEIDRKLEQLRSIRKTLQKLAECCHGDARPTCPILEDLSSGPINGGGVPGALAEERLKHR